jgi:hypothetical protein
LFFLPSFRRFAEQNSKQKSFNAFGNYEGMENVGVMFTPDRRYAVSYHLPSVDIKAQITKSRKF